MLFWSMKSQGSSCQAEFGTLKRKQVLRHFGGCPKSIYVYSGIIRYLDAEDHLAGILGHEIAHAELRHSSTRLQRDFGAEALLTFVALGTPARVVDLIGASILRELMTLSYSRDQEAASDDFSVRYLASSPFACDGAAGFFAKTLEQGDDPNVPEILSDHPDSKARVEAVRRRARELGCSTELGDQDRWRAFQASLPRGETAVDAEVAEPAEEG